ncbi:hypothetical protein FRC08_000158 [Ceratobasidium sp. 394]|nr:hypothetical protein FRC08_000158 [Ceratobasidium sp. 394]
MNIKSQVELDNLLSNTSGLVVVNFFTTTDSSSFSLEELSTQFEHVTFARVDVESSVDDLAKRYAISSSFRKLRLFTPSS